MGGRERGGGQKQENPDGQLRVGTDGQEVEDLGRDTGSETGKT